MAPGLLSVLWIGLLLYHVSYDSEKRRRSGSEVHHDRDFLLNFDEDVSLNSEHSSSLSASSDSSSPSSSPWLSSQSTSPIDSEHPVNLDPEHPINLFHDFLLRYNKTYADIKEYRYRYQNFLRSMRRRRSRVLGGTPLSHGPARYGINQFSDLSPTEFRSHYLTLRIPKKLRASKIHRLKSEKLSPQDIKDYLRERHYPMKWDWRDLGVVTPTKNQGQCGACYATSVVAMIETMRSLKNGRKSEELSVQQILDCKKGATGCYGGDPEDVLEWLNGTYHCHYHDHSNHCRWNKHLLATEEIYPNVYQNQICRKGKNRRGTVQIQGFYCKYGISELDILHYIHRYGPVTVAVDSTSWMDYVGGVIHHNCGTDVNHAVVIVGYEVSDNLTPRYIIKNSWGAEFGDQGYVYVQIGRGLCGIQEQVCGAHV